MAIDLNDPQALQAYLDQILGPAPPEAPGIPTLAPQGLGERILGGFAGAQDLAGQIGFQPHGFGQGLVAGIGSGLGAAGSRVQAQRQKLEQGIAARQSARDEANLKATEDYRKRRSDLVTSLAKEKTPAEIRAEAQARAEGTAAGTPVKPEKTLAQIRAEHQAMAEGTAAAGASASDIAGLSETDLKPWVTRFIRTGQMPTFGMGKAARDDRVRFMKAVSKADPGAGVVFNQAQYAADKQSLGKLQQSLDATTAFQSTAKANAAILRETIGKIPDVGITPINELLRSGAKALGSTAVSNFNTALEVVRPEFARILTSGGTIGGAPLTDSARKELQAVISGSYTKKQLIAALDLLERDSGNRVKSYQGQIGEIQRRVTQFEGSGTAPAATHRYNPATGQAEPIGNP